VTERATDAADRTALPPVVDRAAFQEQIGALRLREKAHTHEGDAIAAARRRLPMTEVDATLPLAGPDGQVTLLETFEGRRQLIAYYHMWYAGEPAERQCEGCTFYTTQMRELSVVHSRDATYAIFCQGPYQESVRYRDFMGLDVPWYSPEGSLEALLAGRMVNRFCLVTYLRDGDRVFETYWTRGRGVEVMAPGYRLLDLTPFGRQEAWEDTPAGRPKHWGAGLGDPYRADGRPMAQWARLQAGYSDDLGDAAR
jgi:predicted dithiol-disulfide oxidoreductase (DUF899 family)